MYAAAYNGAALKKRTSDLVRTDGGHYAAILSVEGELTSFAFDAEGDLWLSVVTTSGGALCRAVHDNWGAAVEQVVTQIDGAPLGAISAVEVGPDGKVYFAVVGDEPVDNGLESALRTELLAHTGTGWVYVYDPADRSVQRVLGGVAGASGLALSADGETLYVSDLGSRCVWSVDADARELRAAETAGAPPTACRATPVRWRWTKTVRCTSASAGAAATGWNRMPTVPSCAGWPCVRARTCSRSCSA